MDLVDLILLAVALAVILLGAELFTNGIEWFGHRLNLAEGAVGSVLAAVATAMPETLIPVIAIVGPAIFGGGSPNSAEIGVGAILGAPFMLATLAMFVTGVAVIIVSRRGTRGTQMAVNVRILGRDVIFFMVAYAIAIATTFLPADLHPVRWAVAAVLVAIYAFYVRAHFSDPAEEGDASELNRLHLTRLTGRGRDATVDLDLLPGEDEENGAAESPPLRIIVTQVVGALALIIIGAQVFVGAVEHLSTAIGLDPRILALIIAPIATELPEKFNSVIWVRSGKDTLAMGNITGAMVFQSCLP
ncbi:MAG: sodium:calcium antiporter, partial [Chloroflexota bacterium]|nr:sodium:calcium antiporter [Chloroflexota bacterium]